MSTGRKIQYGNLTYFKHVVSYVTSFCYSGMLKSLSLNSSESLSQFRSVAQSCPTLCNPMDCSTPGLPVHYHHSWSLLKLMSIESVMPSSHLIFCRPLFLLPPIPPSIRVFSNESSLRMRWPKYWSFSFSISLANKPLDFLFLPLL